MTVYKRGVFWAHLTVLTLATATPWLMWLDLNLMALRFVQIRGHWPMCPTALPCQPAGFYSDDSVKTFYKDPVYQHLELCDWQATTFLLSALVWFILWSVTGRKLPRVFQNVLLAGFILAWAFLIFDPTGAVGWYLD